MKFSVFIPDRGIGETIRKIFRDDMGEMLPGFAVVGRYREGEGRTFRPVAANRVVSEVETAVVRLCEVDAAVVVRKGRRVRRTPCTAEVGRIGAENIAFRRTQKSVDAVFIFPDGRLDDAAAENAVSRNQNVFRTFPRFSVVGRAVEESAPVVKFRRTGG